MNAFSAVYAAQESTVASCVHREVNGTEVMTNLNAEVEFTWVMGEVNEFTVSLDEPSITSLKRFLAVVHRAYFDSQPLPQV